MSQTLPTTLILAITITVALAIIKTPPQSTNATEGSTTKFSCKIRDCERCNVFWRVHDLETFEAFFPVAEDIENVANGNGITTSTLRLVATNSSVVQCMEHNPNAVRKIEKNSYSKYALLEVLKREGSGESRL